MGIGSEAPPSAGHNRNYESSHSFSSFDGTSPLGTSSSQSPERDRDSSRVTKGDRGGKEKKSLGRSGRGKKQSRPQKNGQWKSPSSRVVSGLDEAFFDEQIFQVVTGADFSDFPVESWSGFAAISNLGEIRSDDDSNFEIFFVELGFGGEVAAPPFENLFVETQRLEKEKGFVEELSS